MTTKREPLLTMSQVFGEPLDGLDEGMNRDELVNFYESARAKDAELIQRLVDALDLVKDTMEMYASCQCDGTGCPICRVFDKGDNALFSAAAAGFTPSEQ